MFEINPRFSGTTSLRAMVGYNEPDVLIRHHVLGEADRAGLRVSPRARSCAGLCETYVSPEQMAAMGSEDRGHNLGQFSEPSPTLGG